MEELIFDTSALDAADEQKTLQEQVQMIQEQLQILNETLKIDTQQFFLSYSQSISKQLSDSLKSFQPSFALSESINNEISKSIREFATSISEFVNFELDGYENLSEVLSYIKEYEYLIEPDMSISEALDKINEYQNNDICVDLTDRQITILSAFLSFLDSLQQNQDTAVSFAWILIVLLILFAKEPK